MRIAVLAALVFGVCSPVLGQTPVQKHFVVFNKAGAKFADIGARTELVTAHRDVYKAFADACWTLAGGRLTGDSPLGMTIFAVGVDEVEVKKRVEADPAVSGGYIAVDYRVLEIQMGTLPATRNDCTKK